MTTANGGTGEMKDTTSRLLLQMWHWRSQPSSQTAVPSPHFSAPVYVAQGPGISAEEATKAAEAGGSNSVALPHGIAGMETLDAHEECLGAAQLEARQQEYAEYIKSVLVFVEGEERVAAGAAHVSNDAALAEDVRRAVRWLSILSYNQHSILCDLTGEMIGNMLAPEGRYVFPAGAHAFVDWSGSGGGGAREGERKIGARQRQGDGEREAGTETETKPVTKSGTQTAIETGTDTETGRHRHRHRHEHRHRHRGRDRDRDSHCHRDRGRDRGRDNDRKWFHGHGWYSCLQSAPLSHTCVLLLSPRAHTF